MSKPRIAVIIGSTRATRFGAIPAKWIAERASAQGKWDVEIVDLKDFDLPLFDEVASNAWAPSADPKAVKWQETVAKYDGYIFVTAEYNRSITGALKNAFDQDYTGWNKKAFGIVAYGSVGGARAAEHLRTIGIEMQMASTRSAVHIAGGDFFSVHPGFGGSGDLNTLEASIGASADAMLGELGWWVEATMAQRAKG